MTAAIASVGRRGLFPTRALKNLDLTVQAGGCMDSWPNGAGNHLDPGVARCCERSGSRVLGGDPWHDAVPLHRRMAYVPGDVELWPELTGGEAIDLLGRLRGSLDPARRNDLVKRFDLDTTKKGRTYSKGNRQKVAIVAALASDAELLLLDEPTSGLDPLMEVVFRDVSRAEGGRPHVLLSSLFSPVEESPTRSASSGRRDRAGRHPAGMPLLTRTTIEADTITPSSA